MTTEQANQLKVIYEHLIGDSEVKDTDYLMYMGIDHGSYALTTSIPVSAYRTISIYCDEGAGYWNLYDENNNKIYTTTTSATLLDVSNYNIIKLIGNKTAGGFYRAYIKFII